MREKKGIETKRKKLRIRNETKVKKNKHIKKNSLIEILRK